LISRK